MDKKILLIIPFVIVAGIGIWGLQEYWSPTEKLTIATSPQPVYPLLYVAKSNGYFKDEGLDITFRQFTSGRDSLTNVLEGGSDLATSYETPVVHRTLEGNDLAIITTLHQSTKTTALVGLKSHGINSVDDLAGKIIGVPKSTNAEYMLFSLLTSNEIKLSDVTILDISPQNIGQSLLNESVDAIVVWNPYLYNIKNKFSNEEITVIVPGPTNFSVIVGKYDFVIENKQIMIKLLKAIVKAEDFLEHNNNDAMRITAENLPTQGPMILEIWNDMDYVAKIDNSILRIFEKESQWLKEQNTSFVDHIDFRKVIVSDYLKMVNPDAVTLDE